MSSNPGRSRLAQVARLGRQAQDAEAAGRLEEAASLLKEMARLDPGDRRTLHRLGDLHCIRFKRLREAAGYYAAEARCEERDDFPARALALWRLVVRCDPALLEAHERIGELCVSLGRIPDARLHFEKSAGELERAGLLREAVILRAHLAALADPAASLRTAPVAPVRPPAVAEVIADDNAIDLAADRFQNGRLFHHYGLQQQAREQLEELLVSFPDHVDGRRLLVEVCRSLEDQEAAAEHMRVLTQLLRQQGVAPTAPAVGPAEDPPIEEWIGMEEEEPADPMAELLEEIRDDVERVVDRLERKDGRR